MTIISLLAITMILYFISLKLNMFTVVNYLKYNNDNHKFRFSVVLNNYLVFKLLLSAICIIELQYFTFCCNCTNSSHLFSWVGTTILPNAALKGTSRSATFLKYPQIYYVYIVETIPTVLCECL